MTTNESMTWFNVSTGKQWTMPAFCAPFPFTFHFCYIKYSTSTFKPPPPPFFFSFGQQQQPVMMGAWLQLTGAITPMYKKKQLENGKNHLPQARWRKIRVQLCKNGEADPGSNAAGG